MIANHISSQDRRQPPLDAFFGHVAVPTQTRVEGEILRGAIGPGSPNRPILAEQRGRDSRDLCRLTPQVRTIEP